MPTRTDTTEQPRQTALGIVSSRIPDRYAGVDLKGFDPTRSPSAAKALSAAGKFLHGEAENLVLVGPPGAGKTMLAAAICREKARSIDERLTVAVAAWEQEKAEADAVLTEWYRGDMQGPRPRDLYWGPSLTLQRVPEWVNVPATLIAMRREFGASDHDMADRIHRLGRAEGVVVLDDLGREKVSDWTAEVLYDLANARYEAMLRTVVTSNLTIAELQGTSYWPVISRLSDGGIVLELQTPDQRAKARVRP